MFTPSTLTNSKTESMEKIDLSKPLFQCTLGEFRAMLLDVKMNYLLEPSSDKASKHYVYGIAGIAELFGCSEATANRIKSSGEIDDAISQIGGIIVVDAEYALDLLKISKKYRKTALKKK